MLTSEEIKKYKEDGYLVPNFQMPEKNLLEIEELHNSLVEWKIAKKKVLRNLNFTTSL